MSRKDDIITEMAHHRRVIEGLERELATLDDPEEPPARAIITFQVQFEKQGSVYSYVAHRVSKSTHGERRWALTGTVGLKTWEYIVSLMKRDVGYQAGYATGFSQVTASKHIPLPSPENVS